MRGGGATSEKGPTDSQQMPWKAAVANRIGSRTEEGIRDFPSPPQPFPQLLLPAKHSNLEDENAQALNTVSSPNGSATEVQKKRSSEC
jgi:hypothetical protein